MEDDNTTGEVVENTGVDETQPVESTEQDPAAEAPAVEPSDESTDEEVDETDSAPVADEKLRKYAASQGFELDSPGAIKAAQAALKAQSEATRNYHQKSELEKTLSTASDEYAEDVATTTGQDPELLKRLQRVEVKEAVRDFWSQPDRDRSLEPKMIELLTTTKPHLAGDLESLYLVAESQSGAVKSKGGREALRKLAHTQQAAVPTGNATNSGTTPKAKPFKELSIAEMEAKLGTVRQ